MEIIRGKINSAQKVVIYGPEGIGKSTMASQFPDPLFIDTEGSTKGLDVARIAKPTSWTMLMQQVDEIKRGNLCKTLVIDTVDWAERLGIEYVCAKANKDSITSFGYGEGFIQLEEEVGRLLNKLQDLTDAGINVVLTAHAKINKFEQPDELGAYDRYELKLGNKTTAKTAALVKEWADMVLFGNYKTVSVAVDDKGKKHKAQGGVRVMYTSHHPCWDAKNRHGLPDELPFNYSAIAHCFVSNVTVTEPTQQNVIPQTPIAETIVPTPAPQPVVESVAPAQTETPKTSVVNSNIPKALKDLMDANLVSEQEIKQVVAKKGYYPIDTPVEKYDQNFISGVLVGAWPQVFETVKTIRLESGMQF